MKIIADKLLTETNTEIGLLIGANCLKALEPEVLPSKDRGSFAFRTPLRWCVVELLTKLGRESSISCNSIVVQDPVTRKTAFHPFGISSKVKDINAKQMLENIFNTEFCELRLRASSDDFLMLRVKVSFRISDRHCLQALLHSSKVLLFQIQAVFSHSYSYLPTSYRLIVLVTFLFFFKQH